MLSFLLRPSSFLTAAFVTASLAGSLLGAGDVELKDADGKTIIRYVVEAPEHVAAAGATDPAKQVGLFLCFPEHDRPTGDEILPVREALQRLGLRDQYVLVGGHPQERKFGAADHVPIAKLIEWAKKTYPVNPRRIYMYGKGEGGKISGEIATANPDVVTAAITYSWGWWKMPSELTTAIEPLKNQPEFYMVLGLRDLSYHLTTVRDTYARVSAKGYHVIYREFPELGARTYHPPSNNDAVAWAVRLRNKNLPLSAEETKLLKAFSGSAAPAPGPNGYYEQLALVGGVQAGEAVQRLLESKDAKVRAAAAETCSHGIFSEATMAAVGSKLNDPSAGVRAAALRALGMNANWRSQASQDALTGFVLRPDSAAGEADRAAAVDMIVKAAGMQLRGAPQDPELFRALVTLLEDKDEAIRTMAANTLMPIRDPEFRGDLGRPERKTPEGGWQAWLEETTASAKGYQKDYDACAAPAAEGKGGEAVNLFCSGGGYLLGRNPASGQPVEKDPGKAFQNTLKAAEQGYAPAQNAVALMYANGKGTQQNYTEAAKWWVKAAEAGHLQAASHAAMVYRGGGGVSDPALSAKWSKYVEEKNAAAHGR